MPAMDALTAKNTLAEDLDSEAMRGYLRAFLSSSEGRPADDKHVALTITNLRHTLTMGETYYVSPQMMQLVTAASESMPDEPILPQDLPSPHGFMLIPGALKTVDINGRVFIASAVSWACYGGELFVTLYTDKTDPDDPLANELGRGTRQYRELLRYTMLHRGKLAFGQPLPHRVGPTMLVPPEYGLHTTNQVNDDGSTSMAFWSDKGYSPTQLQEMFEFGTNPDPNLRWLLACWRLMQQPITSLVTEEPTRQMRRALERKNSPAKHVTVVLLRRSTTRGNGEMEREWSHRWLVRGHWRMQPYKEDGQWIKRAIWIHPHIRGPEGKPLLLREHVYSLVR